MIKKIIVTKQDIARSYQSVPNLIHRLPWCDFNEKYKCFLLEDNQSLGVCFKITPIPCEARPDAMMAEIAKSISEAIKNSIPCEKENPWILQLYAHKECNLMRAYHDIENYFSKKVKTAPLTKEFLNTLKDHFKYITKTDGIFHDNQVTNIDFRGGQIYIYAVLYRRICIKNSIKNSRYNRLEEMLSVARKFSNQLRSAGIKIQRMTGKEFHQWMGNWFNPGMKHNFIDLKEKPIGFDLAEQLFYHIPESFTEGWLFNGLPHKVLTIQSMTVNPSIGHLTAERKRNVDDKIFNLMDNLPEGSVFVLTITFQAPSEVALHLKSVLDSAVGRHAQAEKVKNEINHAEKCLAEGDYLFPVTMAVYLKGQTLEHLHTNEAYAEVLLNSNGFKVIIGNDELFPIDAYLRYLPMNYDYYFDKHNSYRSRYMLLSDIAKLVPLYGRSQGTGHPGMVFFNRGGEPWTYDITVDKTKNAHLLLLGETGTGKSNLLNYLIAHDLALYQSRFFIIDAGGSFDLLGDYCQSFGLTVKKIKIDLAAPVALNPFANGLRIIDQIESVDLNGQKNFLSNSCEKLLKEQQDNLTKDILDETEERDILGDMVLAALIMITGGEKKEEEMIRRSDRMLIMDTIIDAVYFVKRMGREQMIASDIVDAFERIACKLNVERDQNKIRRAREMADSMRYFTLDPVSSRFFNVIGNPWEIADVTIIDIGLFAREGYEAHRAITFSSCMSNILSLAESNQAGNRAIKVVCDENHIFTSIPLLADIQTRIAKMGRKLGLWLWLATQNMKDFADGAQRMLSQIETWLCLALPPDEIQQIERFKTLSLEERLLFLSAQKEKGKYTEGVLLSPKIKGLFRNIPPRLYLAMAATDQDEKYLRAQIMKKHQCSEIEAVKIIAEQMMNKDNDNEKDN